MTKRHYADFFRVPIDYKPNMTREAINETPETWLYFYPHEKFIEFLQTLFSNSVLNGGGKSIWLTGNYGTGKSSAALVTEKLFMDDENRVNKWFDDYKGQISDSEPLKTSLFALRKEGTFVVYDYNASCLGTNENFLVRLERTLVTALGERGMIIPAKANLDMIIERIRREGQHFFAVRDTIQGELANLNVNIKTADQLIEKLKKGNTSNDTPTNLLGDVQKVFHHDSIFLDISIGSFRQWVQGILKANHLKRIVYIFDEFSQYIEESQGDLKIFEEVTEAPGVNKFFLVPVTHLSINAYWAKGSEAAKRANDRFFFSNLKMPNDTAFKLAAHAMTPNPDPEISKEWKAEKGILWDAVSSIWDNFTHDENRADYVSKKSFFDILPIHPMTAFLLKFLAESARSNQRSIFEYLKGSADGTEFQDFIRVGGPTIESKQFLTVDYLWKYFIERDDLGHSKEIDVIRSEFVRIRNNSDFNNKLEDDEDIRVLKAVLLFCLLARLITEEGHDRLKPTVENIQLAFRGDGTIMNVDGILRDLAEKHCFSMVNGRIELFASSVGNVDLKKKIEEYEPKFHELLSEKTVASLKEYKKNDLSKFSPGRFEIRVSDIAHTTLTNITSAVRDRYTSGLNKDSGAVCLWFVVAKNAKEQLQISEKIKGLLTQLKGHRILMFSFHSLTFCDNNLRLWEEYTEQYAKSILENDSTAKEQCKKAYERIEREWFDRIKSQNIKLDYAAFVDGTVITHTASWGQFRGIISDYVRQTLPCCVDFLTEQTTAFNNTALKTWALAGLVPENASSGPYQQLLNAFKNDGITGDEEWFTKNSTHPLGQIRALVDKKMMSTISKGTSQSIRKIYIELQRAPYGLKYTGLSAFVIGLSLRHILTRGYQWDNRQKTGPLDADTLAEIIESVVKDDGQDKIKNEKEICRLSLEEKTFIEKAPRMFGITTILPTARVEDVLSQIQIQVEKISGRVPLWVLAEYIRSVEEPLAESIASALDNICLAFTTSSKGKVEERSNSIKEAGKRIRQDSELVATAAKYITVENFIKAFEIYVDKNDNGLKSLAAEIGDVSHGYCEEIKARAAEASGWLWKESDISAEIDTVTKQYEIIKQIQLIAEIHDFMPYKQAFEILEKAVKNKNKLPKTLIEDAFPILSVFLSAIADTKAVTDIRDGIVQNVDILKTLFFDNTKAKSIELLKQRLSDISISNADLLEVYNRLEDGFEQDENSFLNQVRAVIEAYEKQSSALKIKENWKRLTGSMSPNEWAANNGLPARFALENVSDGTDLIAAAESPERFSADRLEELLNRITELSPVGIVECQTKFLAEAVPSRFAKLNINLSSLLDFLRVKYGNSPNSWPLKLDINDFIRGQYKGTFAPQVVEKIHKTSAEDLKTHLLELVQNNPDLGLLFLEG